MPCGNTASSAVIPPLPAGMMDLASLPSKTEDMGTPVLGLARKSRSVLFVGCSRHCCNGGAPRLVKTSRVRSTLPLSEALPSAATTVADSLVGDTTASQTTAGSGCSRENSLEMDYSVASGSSRSSSSGCFASRTSTATLIEDAEAAKDPLSMPEPVTHEPTFGWFEELDTPMPSTPRLDVGDLGLDMTSRKTADLLANPIPGEVLEDSLETQALWYMTNAHRPEQPSAEREHFDLMYTMNMEMSQANLSTAALSRGLQLSRPLARRPSFGTTALAMMPWLAGLAVVKRRILAKVLGDSRDDRRATAKQPPRVLARFACARSSAAAKSFICENSACRDIASVTLKLCAVRVVAGADGVPFAQYHIVVTNEGVTFGIWRRFTHFKKLRLAMAASDPSRFRKAERCWSAVMANERWFRCVEPGHLRRKATLLQRFLYQTLADSARLNLLEEFFCMA